LEHKVVFARKPETWSYDKSTLNLTRFHCKSLGKSNKHRPTLVIPKESQPNTTTLCNNPCKEPTNLKMKIVSYAIMIIITSIYSHWFWPVPPPTFPPNWRFTIVYRCAKYTTFTCKGSNESMSRSQGTKSLKLMWEGPRKGWHLMTVSWDVMRLIGG
jgi:hypothetical protein